MLEQLPVNRKNVPYDLPQMCRFRDCNQRWISVPSIEEIRDHFFKVHKIDLYEVYSKTIGWFVINDW